MTTLELRDAPNAKNPRDLAKGHGGFGPEGTVFTVQSAT